MYFRLVRVMISACSVVQTSTEHQTSALYPLHANRLHPRSAVRAPELVPDRPVAAGGSGRGGRGRLGTGRGRPAVAGAAQPDRAGVLAGGVGAGCAAGDDG